MRCFLVLAFGKRHFVPSGLVGCNQFTDSPNNQTTKQNHETTKQPNNQTTKPLNNETTNPLTMSTTVSCVCPHCKQTINIRRPKSPGRYKYTCTSCKEAFAITFKEQETCAAMPQTYEEKSRPVEEVQRSRHLYATVGGLREKRKGLFSRQPPLIPLHAGSQLIGREDSTYPSDISFGDPMMSRQSLELIVEQHESKNAGYSYILKVRRMLNPVMHNEQQLEQGEEVVLAVGDTITLGSTTLVVV